MNNLIIWLALHLMVYGIGLSPPPNNLPDLKLSEVIEDCLIKSSELSPEQFESYALVLIGHTVKGDVTPIGTMKGMYDDVTIIKAETYIEILGGSFEPRVKVVIRGRVSAVSSICGLTLIKTVIFE